MNGENSIPVLGDAMSAMLTASRIAACAGYGTVGDVTLFYAVWLGNAGLIRSIFGSWVESWPANLVASAKRLARTGELSEQFEEEASITVAEFSRRKHGLFSKLGPGVQLLFTDALPGGPLDELFRHSRSCGGFRIGCAELLVMMALSPSICLQSLLSKSTRSFPTYTALRRSVLDSYAKASPSRRGESRREAFARACKTAETVAKRMVTDIPGQDGRLNELTRAFARNFSEHGESAARSMLVVVPPSIDTAFAVSSLEAAFTEAGLQPDSFPSTDIGCYLHREAVEADMLGTDSSYKSSRQGMLWDWIEHSPGALLCFDGLGKGGAAYPILLALLRGAAVDKFHRRAIKTSGQTVAFLYQPEHCDESALGEAVGQGSDSVRAFVEERLLASGCGQAAEIVRLCREIAAFVPPGTAALETRAASCFRRGLERFGEDSGISIRFDPSMEAIGRLFIQSSSDEPSLPVLMKIVREASDAVADHVFVPDPPTAIELRCDPIPPYGGNPDRRALRGDFLFWKTETVRSGDVLSVGFSGLRWDSRRKREFETYTVRNPKECPPLTGVDYALDELREAARSVSNYECDPDLPLGNTWFLLEGPPGVGKTSLAVALSREFDLPIFSFGRMDDAHALERFLATARTAAPDIVVLDEADSLSVDARYALQRFLDGIESVPAPVVGLLTTNCPERMNGPLLRPGRIGRVISLGLPDSACRASYLKANAKLVHESLSDADYKSLASETDGMSYAHLRWLLIDAARLKRHSNPSIAFVEACRKALSLVRTRESFSKTGRTMGFCNEA